ncbi:MAG: phosphate ABC transporter substrate-binding protein PstS [Acidimicrobiales bacterium]
MKATLKTLLPAALAAAALLGACGSSSPTSSSTTTTTGSAPGSSTTVASAPATSNPPSAVTLDESGSSLVFPFLQALVTPLHQAFSNVTLAPAAGGSGKGISDATAGISALGGSDAYLTTAELGQGLANIPIAVSAQDVFYHLPGIANLKLSGSVLSQMYQGKITTWDAPAVTALNPGVTIPATKVIPIHRSDSSGDTFLFTGYLSKADPNGWGGSSGPGQGTTVTWPSVPAALTASGNPGMVSACQQAAGCVAYVGISAQVTAQQAMLQEAQLGNQAGDFVTADATTINDAVTSGAGNVGANLVADLLYAPGAMSYPIVNFEYMVLKSQQSDPNVALAIRDFLTFAISTTGGSTPALLGPEDFQALPSTVLPKVYAAISAVQ